MTIEVLNESQFKEILREARDGEKKFKEMSDRSTIISEKWRVKTNTAGQKDDKNDTLRSKV